MSDQWRIEHDSMGEVKVPASAKWGAQTQRAVQNFPISGLPIDERLVQFWCRLTVPGHGIQPDQATHRRG